MDKVYLKYKEALMTSGRLMEELGGRDGRVEGETDSFGMNVVRKDVDLTNMEKQYLLAVERGDIPSTRTFLSHVSSNGININCVDPLGRTALLIAIENENIEMVELLLNHNIEVGDALLHAINEENVEAVELLLNHEAATKGEDALLQSVPSSSFTPDITPIILAAHRDNYEIIKILLDRGYRIPKPHDVRCDCKSCETGSSDDSLRHSRSRINAYKALASPSLIALSSKDPILTAFEISCELKRLSRVENEFKEDYEKLAEKCQDFAVDLLEQTRGSRELQIILNHETGAGSEDSVGEKMKLSRLKLAIKYKQKKFVAHPNCQQLLGAMWYEGLPGFRRKNIVSKLVMCVTLGLLFPILSIVYLIAPTCGIGRLIRKPFIKFIIHACSYLTFLFFLILVSQRVEIPLLDTQGTEQTKDKVAKELRGAPASTVEWMILAYVAGFVWAEIKQLWDEGAKEYIHDMWNILDFVTNSLYLATFTLRLLAYLQVQEELALNLPQAKEQRRDWNAYDPNLISEALFAAANIFSSLKLIYIFMVNPHLGPLEISLGRMINDIFKYFCLYFLVLFSFACGLNHLYWYYATIRANECAKDPTQTLDSCDRKYKSFANLFEILQSLYWALFGLVDLEHAELGSRFKHEFTEFIGKLMFGSYCFVSLVVLLNMLIAMMSNSYQYISSQADVEWKFSRSKLWISYFEDSGTLPPPFNIIPSPKTFFYIMVWFKNKLCACSKQQKRNRWQSIKKIVKKINEREIRYQAVMRDLIKRYIMQKQRSPQKEGVNEDDINELKQDVSSFRYELLEILRNNGMKTPDLSQPKPSNRRLSKKRSQLSLDRLKRSLSMEPLHELASGMGSGGMGWRADGASLGSNVPSPASTLSLDSSFRFPGAASAIPETIPEEEERRRRESMKVERDELFKPQIHVHSGKDGDGSQGEENAEEAGDGDEGAEPQGEGEVGGGGEGAAAFGTGVRRDEGLGESFDQCSEVSDSASRNSMADPLPAAVDAASGDPNAPKTLCQTSSSSPEDPVDRDTPPTPDSLPAIIKDNPNISKRVTFM